MQIAQDRAAVLKVALLGHPGPQQTAVIRSAIYVACEGTGLIPKRICDDFAPVGSTLTADDICRIETLADFLIGIPNLSQSSIELYKLIENRNCKAAPL
jgi:hypothetical protein